MHTNPLIRLSSLVALAFVVVGCKPGAEDLCERYAKAQCSFQYDCCNAVERRSTAGGGGLGGSAHNDKDSCIEELTRAYCAALNVYADAEREGRATWNYEQANTCLSEVETAAASCDAEVMIGGGTLNDDCGMTELLTGTVADGDTCYDPSECANEEAVCAPNESEEEDEILVTRKGTCTPPPGVGDECPDFFCTESAWCDVSEDPATCKAKKQNGDGCQSGLECDSAICDFSTGEGQCAPKKPNGAPCFADSECSSEFCDDVAGECADKRDIGEPCDDDNGCQSGFCDPSNGQCGALLENEVNYDICKADEQ